MIGWNFDTLSAICEKAEAGGISAFEYANDIGFDDLEGLELLRIRDCLRGFQADAMSADIEGAKRSLQEFARNREDECGRFLDSIERGGKGR